MSPTWSSPPRRIFQRTHNNVSPYSDTGPERLARYLNRIVFCLYAEDAGLLPAGILSDILNANRQRPDLSNRAIANLFEQMAGGGLFGAHEIAHFNGDLFRPDEPVELSASAMQRLGEAVSKNWRNIEPSIFGTLFERALDASQRARLGAHYTGADDIMLVINPVVMDPLEREWEAVRGEIEELDNSPARQRLEEFRQRLASVTVLDPARGSGNFLYLALRSLLDLEKRVIDYAAMRGWHGLMPMVKPNQMRGLEINPYAAELARTALWIGYIQWHQSNGFPYTQNPILTPLDTIRQTDAILDLSDPENPAEPEWPAAEFIVGIRRFWDIFRSGNRWAMITLAQCMGCMATGFPIPATYAATGSKRRGRRLRPAEPSGPACWQRRRYGFNPTVEL